jgi:hypothetical protein
MAIQKVSVSTKSYSVPQLKSKILPNSDPTEYPFLSDTITEENIIELDYLYNVSPLSITTPLPLIETHEPEIENEKKFRYPTLGIEFLDRDPNPDSNGVETDPIIDTLPIIRKEKMARIILPYAKYPSPGLDYSPAHIKQVWDNGIANLNKDLDAIKDRAIQMGKDVVNSLTGFHPLPDETYEERLPTIVGNLYNLAYVPFMVNSAQSPNERTDGANAAPNKWDFSGGFGNYVKNLVADVVKKDTKYPVYPTYQPTLNSINFNAYLNSSLSSDSIKLQDNAIQSITNLRHMYRGLFYTYKEDIGTRMNGRSNDRTDSRAYFPPSIGDNKRIDFFYDVFNTKTYSSMTNKIDEYYLEVALKQNSIGDNRPYMINLIEQFNKEKKKDKDGNPEKFNVSTFVVGDHYKKYAYFPLQFKSSGEPIFPKKKDDSQFEAEDFYNLTNERESTSVDSFFKEFYKRVTSSNIKENTRWEYIVPVDEAGKRDLSPYTINVVDFVKAWLKSKAALPAAEKDKFFQEFNVIKISNDNQKVYKNKYVESNNFSPYAMIERIGPDFLQHKFDAYFVWDIYGSSSAKDWDEILQDYKWLSDYEKYILSKKGFAVRVGQITIPKISNDEFSIPFLETEVKKVKSTKSMNTQSSFTIRLDQGLFWLDMINGMAGHLNTIDEHLFNNSDIHPYIKSIKNPPEITKNDGHPGRWRSILKTIARSWPPGTVNNSYKIKDSELCLVVKMSHLSNWVNTNKQQHVLPYFIFENVRILGTSDKIQYSKESNIQSITVNFLFKRCYEVTQEFKQLDQFGENKWIKTTNQVAGPENLDYNFEITRKPEFFKQPGAKGKGIDKYYGLPKVNTYENSIFDWTNASGDEKLNKVPELLENKKSVREQGMAAASSARSTV